MHSPRQDHTSTLLNNGLVLIAGGYNGGQLSGAELYNQTSGTFTLTGSLTTSRYGHTATLLNDGEVLLAGGCCDLNNRPLSNAELYNPLTGTFVATGILRAARSGHRATKLNNGQVLVTGGYNGSVYLSSAELYQ